MKLLALTVLVCPWPLLQEGRTAVAPTPQATPVDRVITIYDVRDLLDSMVADFEPPDLGPAAPVGPRVSTSTGARTDEAPRPGPTEAERRVTATKSLDGLIRKYLTPKSELVEARLEFTQNGALIASLSPEGHRWLESFLNAQRAFTGLVRIETRLFKIPRGRLATLGVGTSASFATSEERDAFIARLNSDKQTTAITAPAVLVYPNQRANVSVLSQLSYIKDYTIHVVEPGQQHVVDPEVAVINEGVVLDVKPTPMPGDAVTLDLEFKTAEVLRPIPTRKVRLDVGSESEGEIGLPEVRTARILATVSLANGASVAVSTPGSSAEEDLLLLITLGVVSR